MTTTKRYYYTDPLAAAWMARRFGMNLMCYYLPDDEGVDEGEVGRTYDFRDAMVEGGSVDMWGDVITADCRRIYIHPDSLHLLQAQPDDVILTYSIERFPIAARWSIFSGGVLEWDAERPEGTRIVQRNGIAFHWPEVEPAA